MIMFIGMLSNNKSFKLSWIRISLYEETKSLGYNTVRVRSLFIIVKNISMIHGDYVALEATKFRASLN